MDFIFTITNLLANIYCVIVLTICAFIYILVWFDSKSEKRKNRINDKLSDEVKQRIAAGADINASDEYVKTPLMLAASKGYTEICKLLIDKGADVNFRYNYGMTPLMFSAFQGNHEICKILIDKGADVHASDNDGWTPLMFAAAKGRTETVELLKKHGAKR